MAYFAIRCHPYVPVSIGEFEHWLHEQVERLRADQPHGVLRLSRLSQSVPSGDREIGWLLEFDLPEEHSEHAPDHLTGMLTDMRLLGLQVTLLSPHVPAGGETHRNHGVTTATVASTVGAGS
jgi:hypothetical protein